MDDALRCYRHPDRETYVRCSECDRPICEECMTFAPVGIRCPDHASVGGPAPGRAPQTPSARQALARSASPATMVLVAINVAVFVITVAQGAGLNAPGGVLIREGALVGALVADGEWWRLVTSMFLHASLLHLGFNMLALWWLGAPVEQALGTVRFLLVYFVSGLAGAAGALLMTDPFTTTVGASGAIYGIMGSLLILEWMATGTLAGSVMGLILINLAITFTIPNISVGGHLGGLVGGILSTLVLVRTRHANAYLGPVIVVALGVASVALAWFRVDSYPF